MLDVGHGLAVVIEREGKAVIFDTGNRWQASSAAERNILPFLRWRQISLEQIVISHSHLDHIGGLPILAAAFPQASVRTPIRERWLPALRSRAAVGVARAKLSGVVATSTGGLCR